MEKALAGPARFIPVQRRRKRGAGSLLLGAAVGEVVEAVETQFACQAGQ